MNPEAVMKKNFHSVLVVSVSVRPAALEIEGSHEQLTQPEVSNETTQVY